MKIDAWNISVHAREQMTLRGLTEQDLEAVLYSPDKVIPSFGKRLIAQKLRHISEGKAYLYRVILDASTQPLTVITAYRTSNVEKYQGE